MKKNIILISVIILLLLLIVAGIIIYMVLNNQQKVTEEKPIEINKDLMIVSIGDSYVNNVKDSKKICKITLKVEINQEVAELITYRESEIRDSINALLRSKTEADLAGKEGQESLKKEILEMVRKIINSKKVMNVYFDEFIVQ